jgi:SnoaL-like protein
MTTMFDDLLQLTHRFYFYLDESHYADLVATFREDGVWHRQGKALKGHAQIMAAMQERPRTQRTRHVISNAFLSESDQESATLIAYMTAYRFNDGSERKPPYPIDGPLRFLLVKIRFQRERGAWRIAEQWGTPEFDFTQQ